MNFFFLKSNWKKEINQEINSNATPNSRKEVEHKANQLKKVQSYLSEVAQSKAFGTVSVDK